MHDRTPAEELPTDPYEVLQLHPKADPLLVMSAFRVLATMYHPDNKQTGDRPAFERVVAAYRLLSDPVRRAGYDRAQGRSAAVAGVLVPNDSRGRGAAPDERGLRMMLLATLYTVRRSSVTKPGLSLRVLADMTDSEIDDVQFSLWYLRGKKLIEVGDDDAMAITVAGVDYVEEHGMTPAPELLSLPNAPGTVSEPTS